MLSFLFLNMVMATCQRVEMLDRYNSRTTNRDEIYKITARYNGPQLFEEYSDRFDFSEISREEKGQEIVFLVANQIDTYFANDIFERDSKIQDLVQQYQMQLNLRNYSCNVDYPMVGGEIQFVEVSTHRSSGMSMRIPKIIDISSVEIYKKDE